MAIETSQWKINKHAMDYDEGLIQWVKRINKDFRQRGIYAPFELYKKQAKEWLNDDYQFSDCKDYDEQVWWLKREHKRCKENTLFEANKYGYLKDPEDGGDAEIDYTAWECQAIILHLLDRGYSALIGKGRQVGLTSTIGLYCKKKLNYNKNFFIKFVTHSLEKGMEIFDWKIKYAFGRIPDYLRHEVSNDNEMELTLKDKKTKGKTGGMNSSLLVAAPAIDAINGGSPQLVAIDEAGLFNEFGKIMREGRPTLFKKDKITKKQTLKRQFVAWTTGGQVGLGTTAFQEEFYSCLRDFNDGTFSYGMIPIFLNAYARDGVDDEFLADEKKVYYSKQGVEGEYSKVQYHQHYPMTIEDMFLSTAQTLVPIPKINLHLQRIYDLEEKPQWGYFVPVYDQSKPTTGSGHPYKIKGAEWVPVSDQMTPNATVCIMRHPEPGWLHRYYQGTDPINSESGHSKMASAIWDANRNDVAACLNWRVKDRTEVYTQCLLMGLYYNPELGVKELVEMNIGDDYVAFKERMGWDKNLTAQAALPIYLQTNTTKWWGVNNRSQTNNKIINYLTELLDAYGDNINVVQFWVQMKTFVEKALIGKNQNTAANVTGRLSRFQAADLKRDFDDVIFGITYAYMNARAHERFVPKNLSEEKTGGKRTIRKYVQDGRTNWEKRYCEVTADGKILKFIRNTR
jgi:hypothetical protein